MKWRSKLAAEGAVITKGFDGSLKLYPATVWQGIAEKLANLPQSQPQARAYVRQTLAGAVDVEFDKLGRLLVPGFLREYASLEKEAVLAGLHDHIELWSDVAWSTYMKNIDQDSSEFNQTLQDLGI